MPYQTNRNLAELAAFAAVAKHGGFSAAARAAGLRKASLSERVRALEERLGVKLVVRSTRVVRLTEQGRVVASHAQRALDAARDAEAAARASLDKPTGTLRISVSPLLAAIFVEGALTPYLRAYPEVSVEIDASIRTVDLVREEFDVAVRVGQLSDSALSMRRLGQARGGYFASRAYLARRGAPEQPADLTAHDTIAMRRGDRLPQWHFVRGRRKQSVIVHPRLWVTSVELAIAAGVSGLGIIPCTRHAVRTHLARKALVPVLEDWTAPAFEVNALFVAGSTAVPKTRLAIDHLARWFAAQGGSI